MRLRLRKPVAFGLACALEVFGISPALAQQQGVALKAHVSPAFSLSIKGHQLSSRFEIAADQTSPLRMTVERVGLSEARITLIGGAQNPAMSLSVPLEIRTNAPYEMRIERLLAEGCGPKLVASVDSIRPSGAAVAFQAASYSRQATTVDLSSPDTSAAILSGPRVSLAGSLTSPANALLLNLAFDVAEQSRQCDWQVTLQISLNPSSR